MISNVSSPGLKNDKSNKKSQGLEVIQESDFQHFIRNDSNKTSSQHVSEAKKIQMNFESPKNRNRGTENSKSDTINLGSYIDSNINPLESPDLVMKQKPLRFNDNSESFKLRANRISEVPNETSECETVSPVKESDIKVLASTPNLTDQKLLTKGLRKTYSNQKDLISSSLDRFNFMAFNGLDKQNEDVQLLKKQLREDKAKFVKQKAILEQQVELLTMQLHEASEREKSIKKTYTTMM